MKREMLQKVGKVVPNIDEVLIMDCEMMSTGKNIHSIRGDENAYMGSTEGFTYADTEDEVNDWHRLWLECYSKLSGYRKQGRRARLANSVLTRKYVC